MTSRTIRCGICHGFGHNRRTCWMRNVTFTRGSNDIPLWDEAIEDIGMVEPHDLSIEIPNNFPVMTPPPAPRKKKRTKTPKRQKPYIQKDNNCNICFDDLKDTNKVITKCGHKFCVECYTRACRNNNDCAVCRKKLCSVELENWKRRYEEMEQDCEYYRNIVGQITGIINPDILNGDSIPDDSDMELDEEEVEEIPGLVAEWASAIANGQRV